MMCRHDASSRYLYSLDRFDVSVRYIWILCGPLCRRKCEPISVVSVGAAGSGAPGGLRGGASAAKDDQIRARLTTGSDVRWAI
jgi:hypothetical protein